MSKKTKNIFIVSILVASLSLVILALFIFKIQAEGERLKDQVAILTESAERESAYVQLKRLVQDTESQRGLLAASFFKDEGESIIFLGEIETLASALGIVLETESLDKVLNKPDKSEAVRMTFSYEGPKDTVQAFSRLMEVTPYHSQVEGLSLRKITNDDWEGKLTILISINSL